MPLYPILVVLLGALPLACVRPGAVAPLPVGMRTVAVAPPEDRTGTVLGGERYLERLLGQPRVTLADALAAEVRAVLARRGFDVAAAGAITDEAADAASVATLALEIRRWEPDVPALRFVLVSLDARLVDAPGATALWSVRRDDWEVPTRGAPTPEAASTMAARTVAETLVGDWRPGSG
jgi:hypothetical protein